MILFLFKLFTSSGRLRVSFLILLPLKKIRFLLGKRRVGVIRESPLLRVRGPIYCFLFSSDSLLKRRPVVSVNGNIGTVLVNRNSRGHRRKPRRGFNGRFAISTRKCRSRRRDSVGRVGQY